MNWKVCIVQSHYYSCIHSLIHGTISCNSPSMLLVVNKIALYFTDSILELCKCKYSKFLVKKFLIYWYVNVICDFWVLYTCTISPQQREEIMSFFNGHVRRLIRHTEAASLVELAYNDYANVHQREALTREFYGAIVSVILALRIQQWCHIQTVGDEKQYRVRRLKETITPLLNK